MDEADPSKLKTRGTVGSWGRAAGCRLGSHCAHRFFVMMAGVPAIMGAHSRISVLWLIPCWGRNPLFSHLDVGLGLHTSSNEKLTTYKGQHSIRGNALCFLCHRIIWQSVLVLDSNQQRTI